MEKCLELQVSITIDLLRLYSSHRPASPIKHVAYSNDGSLFATASQVIHKIIEGERMFSLRVE